MKRLYISTDVDNFYITAGKWYRCFNNDKDTTNVVDDEGMQRYMLFSNCAHLNGSDWKVMTTETINDKPLYNYTKIGETFVNIKGQTIKVVKDGDCDDCVLDVVGCCGINCIADGRGSVIFKEIV